MATYKIIKHHTTTEEVELELPYYTKNICFAHKVLDSEKSIQVCFSNTDFGIKESYASTAFSNDVEPCSEDEFNRLFDETMNKLKSLR